jgi:hypothetical protein
VTSHARAASALTVPQGAGGALRLAPAAFAFGLDAAAATMLFTAAPHPDAAAAAIAACLHVAAALLLAGWPGRDDGRRLLGAASVLAVPCVGAAIAAAVLASRGDGHAALARDLGRPLGSTPARPAAPRCADLISSCDALLDGDDERRRAILADLARRADPQGIMLLRWAARGDDPDLALLAALALDEISERAEGRSPLRDTARKVRHVAG